MAEYLANGTSQSPLGMQSPHKMLKEEGPDLRRSCYVGAKVFVSSGAPEHSLSRPLQDDRLDAAKTAISAALYRE